MGIIYKITHRESGKSYIGQTKCSLRVRLNGHRSKPGCPYIGSAIKKYGMDAFEVSEILHTDDVDFLNAMEIATIEAYDTLYPNGYNLRNGGDGSYHHAESKAKIAKKAQEQFSSQEVRLQSSLSRGGQPFTIRDIQTQEVVYSGVNKNEAARALNICRSSLQSVLSGESITVSGYVAKYESDATPWPTVELWTEFMVEMARCKALCVDSPKWPTWILERGSI